MTIEATLIQDEINRIIEGPEKPVNFYWSAVIHANGKDFPMIAIESIDFDKNYNEEIADSIDVTGLISPGTYQVDILPYDANLEITLTKSVAGESNEEEVVGATIQVERYIAKLKSDGPTQSMKGAVDGNITKETADLGGLKTVSFQLLNSTLEQLRMVMVGGIYRNVKPGDVLRAIIGSESKKVKTSAGIAIKGVDMVPANNEVIRDHVIIPPTKLLGLPDFIQTKCGGVYSAGMGFYLQNGLWYIYPKLDVGRFSDKTKTLTIIVVPPNKYPGVTRTYRETANQVIIISTRGINHWDDSEEQQLNFGNGVRFTDGSKIMEGFGTAEGNKFTVARKDNNSEVILSNRQNGVDRAMISSTPIHSNPFVEYSKMARANCEHLQATWEHSNESLIYPGMPVRIVYVNDSEISENYGSVLAAHFFVMRAGTTVTTKRHVTSGAITMVMKKKV